MITLTCAEIADILDAELIGDGDITIDEIFTDSRSSCHNGLFVALVGQFYNAHNYISYAIEAGAVAVMVEHRMENITVPQIIVPDTHDAFGQLGAWLKAKIMPITAAITGSCGKTTVKEMTASILKIHAKRLGLEEDAVLFTEGNLNNDLGVPITLLRMTEKTRFAIIELGANHKGEIAYTVDLVKPDLAMVNNVTDAHLEGFGTINDVAEAKGEIYDGLDETGIALYNKNCYSPIWPRPTPHLHSFSATDTDADFYATDIEHLGETSRFTLHTPKGEKVINLAYTGDHNISNALAAAAIACYFGANLEEIALGLNQKMPLKGRLFFDNITENLTVIDDTYNANVGSMKAAIDVLKLQQGKKIFVAGDMAEMGDANHRCHHDVGVYAANADLDAVLTIGESTWIISELHNNGKHFPKIGAEDLINHLIELCSCDEKVTVLFKGSRSMKMENLIQLFKEKQQC